MSIEISEELLELAMQKFDEAGGYPTYKIQWMREALAAVVGELLGEPVGLIPITDAIFVAPDFQVTTPMIYGAPEYYLGRKEKLVPLYAIKQGASRDQA